MLLADVRPYVGWYLLVAVVCGIVVAVALPWILVREFRASPQWAGWALLIYTGTLVAPGPIGRWLRAWRSRRAHATPDLTNTSRDGYIK